MKKIQALLFTAVFAVILSFSVNAYAQTVKQGVVTIVRIKGEARYSGADKIWHPLTSGAQLGAGDVIQTGVDSTVDMILSEKPAIVGARSDQNSLIGTSVEIAGLPQFHPGSGSRQSAPEQNIVRIQPNSVLAVDKFFFTNTGVDKVSDTELDLRAGKIFGNVKKISAASTYTVKTPTAVAGIRGTMFLLGSDGTVTVLQGSVVVSSVGANGQVVTTVLGAGDQYDPQTGLVTKVGGAELAAAIQNATQIVLAIHTIVTVVEPSSLNGDDTTKIQVSPTSGHSVFLVIDL